MRYICKLVNCFVMNVFLIINMNELLFDVIVLLEIGV